LYGIHVGIEGQGWKIVLGLIIFLLVWTKDHIHVCWMLG